MNFKEAIVYQIYPKSFFDSDGDGLGDLRGAASRLDHVAELGANMIWLNPFFRSPQRDNGYDVADYRDIEPFYGDMDDLRHLISEAKRRGLGVMFDMVFNHTSTEHPWFRRALAGDKHYQDFYFFVDGAPDAPPTNWQSKFGGSAWAWAPEVGKWYLHLFDATQADLNWENPNVRRELAEIVSFWKEKGVTGFRFDVINLVSKSDAWEDDHAGDGRRFYTDGPRVHEYLRELAEAAGLAEVVTVGEMSSTTVENCILYTRPDRGELNMAFNFHHLKVDYAGGQKWQVAAPDMAELRRLLLEWQTKMSEGGGWMALFFGNHDQPRQASRFANEDPHCTERVAKLLALMTMTMRGTPFIFQGEELGLPNARFASIDAHRDVESHNAHRQMLAEGRSDAEAMEVLRRRSRDQARTPMRWTREGGFSAATPWMADPHAGKTGLSVAEQQDDPHSVLSFCKRCVALRKEAPFVDGDFVPLELPFPLMGYERVEGEKRARLIFNLSAEIVPLPHPKQFAEISLGNVEAPSPGVLQPFEARLQLH